MWPLFGNHITAFVYLRYQRGSRSLADNLLQSKETADKVTGGSAAPTTADDDDEEEYDIPDEIEEVIGTNHNEHIIMVFTTDRKKCLNVFEIEFSAKLKKQDLSVLILFMKLIIGISFHFVFRTPSDFIER